MTSTKNTSSSTLNDAYELFALDNQARRLTKSTQKFYKEKLRAFLKWVDATTLLSEVTSKHIRLATRQFQGKQGKRRIETASELVSKRSSM